MGGRSHDIIKLPVERHALRIVERSLLGGVLVMVPGTLGYITGNMWLFPSLGPSIFLMVLLPHLETARTYNTFIGHLVAIACGYAAVLAISSTGVPSAVIVGHLLMPHVIAAGLAVTAMMLLQLAVRAMHPPGASTAIMIALGAFSATWHDCLTILTGVTIMTIAGEAARRFLVWREREVVKP